MSCVVDGANMVFVTNQELIDPALFSSGGWTNIKGGLHIVGKTGQAIELFDPSLNSDNLTIKILDKDGELFETMMAGSRANAGDYSSFITSDVTNSDTTINVKSTVGLAASGEVHIGHECISYVSTGSTTIGVLSRGVYSLFGSGFGRYHRMSEDVTGDDTNAPKITSWPRAWYNRRIGIYVHAKEDGAWTDREDSLLLWAGNITSWREDGNGVVQIVLQSVISDLSGEVFADQFTAKLGTGRSLANTAEEKTLRIFTTITNGGGYIEYDLTADLTDLPDPPGPVADPGSRYHWSEWIAIVQHQFSKWQVDGDIDPDHRVSIGVVETETGPRVSIKLEDLGGGATGTALVGMHKDWLRLLGFSDGQNAGQFIDTNGTRLAHVLLERTGTGTDTFERIAQDAPIDYHDPGRLDPGGRFGVIDARGTWVIQPTDTLKEPYQPEIPLGLPAVTSSTEGFLAIANNNVIAIQDYDEDDDDSTKGIFMVRLVPRPTGPRSINPEVRVGDGESAPEVRQVWLEGGPAGEVLLRIMLSTGTPGYNGTYDVYGPGFGLGLPEDMVNVSSFESLRDRFEFCLEKPKSFGDVLEGILAATGRYVIWKDGQIALSRAGFDTPNVADIIELDESNKAKFDDICEVTYSSDTIINSIALKFGPHELVTAAEVVSGSAAGDRAIAKTIIVESAASVSDYRRRKTMEVECIGLQDPKSWADYVAAPAIAYFSRPAAKIKRTFNYKVLHLAPGDICKITDNRIVDPTTGLRGVAGLACWVSSVEYDWDSGVGTVELVFVPDHPASRYCQYSPSARVTTYFTGTSSLIVQAHAYSRSGEGVDASYFSAGDKVRIIELSPTDITNPVVYPAGGTEATIQSVNAGANTIVLTSDPTGGSGLSGTMSWVLEAGRVTEVVTTQRDKAFIASAASGENYTTGFATNDARRWAGSTNRFYFNHDSTPPTYTEMMVRQPTVATTKGRPLSAHVLHHISNSLNNHLAYKSRPIYINELLRSEGNTYPTHNATTKKCLTFWYVPLFGSDRTIIGGPRDLVVKVLLGKQSSTGTSATCVITSSPSLPTDQSNALDVSFARASSSVTFTSTASSPEWQTEQILTPSVLYADPLPYTYITAELSALGGTAELRAIYVVEAPIT
jgi:hypothetical protein